MLLHSKKKVREFPVPSRDVTTKLSLSGNNDVITELFLSRGSLVSDIPAGDGKLVNLFLRCRMAAMFIPRKNYVRRGGGNGAFLATRFHDTFLYCITKLSCDLWYWFSFTFICLWYYSCRSAACIKSTSIMYLCKYVRLMYNVKRIYRKKLTFLLYRAHPPLPTAK